jgi:hypothetical protein
MAMKKVGIENCGIREMQHLCKVPAPTQASAIRGTITEVNPFRASFGTVQQKGNQADLKRQRGIRMELA